MNYYNKETLLSKWSDREDGSLDRKLIIFNECYDNWIEQFDSKNQGNINELIHEFEYYSKKKVNQCLKNFYQKLCDKNVTFDGAIFSTFTKKATKANSSMEHMQTFISENELYHVNFYTDFKEFVKEETKSLKFVTKIFFVDDICGTGGSFKKELKKIKVALNSKNINLEKITIYYLVIHIMEEGKKNIESFGIENGLSIKILSMTEADKIINNNKLSNSEEVISSIVEESRQYSLNEEYLLGYKDSQSLAAFYNNTPNNTPAIIWENQESYTPLFERTEKMKLNPQYMKERKKERKKQLDEIKKGGVDISDM